MPYREDICVNGEPAELSTKLYDGDIVTWEMEVKISVPEPAFEVSEPEITERDDDVMAESLKEPEETVQATTEPITEETIEEKQEEPEETEPVITPPPVNLAPPSTDCFITVNGKVVVLKGKTKYLFVDILDFYPFDVSKAYGNTVVLQINGNKAEFSSPIADGDIVDLYWK